MTGGNLHTADGNVKWYTALLENSLDWQLLKKLKKS